jgi:hypothetical protein
MRHTGSRWVSADGQWVIDVISLTLTGTSRDGTWLRIRHHGFFAGEVRRPEDLARFPFSPAELGPARARRGLVCRAPPARRLPCRDDLHTGTAHPVS